MMILSAVVVSAVTGDGRNICSAQLLLSSLKVGWKLQRDIFILCESTHQQFQKKCTEKKKSTRG